MEAALCWVGRERHGVAKHRTGTCGSLNLNALPCPPKTTTGHAVNQPVTVTEMVKSISAVQACQCARASKCRAVFAGFQRLATNELGSLDLTETQEQTFLNSKGSLNGNTA